MKKYLIILVVVISMLSCTAFAESAILQADPQTVVTIDRTSHVTTWEGKWNLVAAYIGEDVVEEWGLDVKPGLFPVKENALVLEVGTILNGSANDPSLGTIVDQGAYLHAHVHDMEGTLTFAEDLGAEDVYKISSAWDEWAYVVRGEMDGDFNMGPAKTHIKGDNETLFWNEIVGVEMEDMEEMKYITMNTSGNLILCYAEKNLTKEKNNTIGFGYIFERAAE